MDLYQLVHCLLSKKLYFIIGQFKVKKITALTMLIATAILSGAAMSKFLNWAGQIEIFDFDLDEDIDNEEL
jgi:hypothetical protein